MDALYRDWQAAGAALRAAPESKPWGLHEFTAADLDGNLFRVFYDYATPARAGTAQWRPGSGDPGRVPPSPP